ncbi:hypothetical protein LPB67_14175 [Undibacterium sp. Jales W-56]|uniref:trypsin-like serine peptidase n=1 Tax=Undibacterium sp. Jales W-56 TaxID=2897325 RepID=UPI0021D10359|nr:hypothetical protein [Undibacterium sp. Jales W-56]MCU6434920.1 hypothetical protein [Undibacterium sp. Jales W-56]
MKKKSFPLFFVIALSSLFLLGCGGKNGAQIERIDTASTKSDSPIHADEIRSMPPAPVLSTVPEKSALLNTLKLPLTPGITKISLGRPSQAEAATMKTSALGIRERQHQIGFSRALTNHLDQSSNSWQLRWTPLPNGGQVASLSVTSTNAAAVRIGMVVTQMPNGMEIRFVGSDDPNKVVGPIVAGQIQINQTYWSPALDGDTATLEIFLPAGARSADLDFHIANISHLVSTPSSQRSVSAAEKGASYCEVDLACVSSPSPALSAAGNSIAKMIYTKIDGSSYLCTGTLLNNTAKDPLFFSANHCISDQQTASTLNTYWFYEAASCGGGLKQVVQLFNGATLLYNSVQDDFLLLKLNDAPPANANYAGWDANTITPQNVIGIHHPRGDIKKISTGTTDANFTIVNDKGLYIPVKWQTGITEPGSSGSGLFTFSAGYYVLRGALYAGSSACETPTNADYFSRLDLAYPSIKQYLTTKPIPQTGWWWNPTEGGRGFTIEIANNKMFFAGYLYDQTGRATWYASGPTAMTSDSVYIGNLIAYQGGQTLTGNYKTASLINGSQGNLTITFSDNTHGTLMWPGGTISIERFNIVPGGVNAEVPANTPEAGWWWNPDEGGRGFSVEIQNGNMFLAGYMYDNLGNPIWYASGPMKMTDAATYEGVWQQYGNGQTLTGSYKPAIVVAANAGRVIIRFSDKRNAVLTLPNNKNIPITRFTF